MSDFVIFVPLYPTLKEAIGALCHFKIDNNPNKNGANILMSNSHAYNLHKVYFCNSQNRSLNDEKESDILDNLDVKLSTAIVQNPHAKTKPNYHEEEKRKDDGTFRMSLETLLRIIDKVTTCTVENHRNDN